MRSTGTTAAGIFTNHELTVARTITYEVITSELRRQIINLDFEHQHEGTEDSHSGLDFQVLLLGAQRFIVNIFLPAARAAPVTMQEEEI